MEARWGKIWKKPVIWKVRKLEKKDDLHKNDKIIDKAKNDKNLKKAELKKIKRK